MKRRNIDILRVRIMELNRCKNFLNDELVEKQKYILELEQTIGILQERLKKMAYELAEKENALQETKECW